MGLDRTGSSVFCVYLLLLQYIANILILSIPFIIILLITFYYTNQRTMFAHYIYLLYFSYVFRRYIHHGQGETFLPFIQTTYCYVAISYRFNSSYVMNF